MENRTSNKTSIIIPINIGIVFIGTAALQVIGYNSSGLSGLKFFNYSIVGLIINLGFLILFATISYKAGNKNTGKTYLLSTLFSIGTFICVTILFSFLSTWRGN